MTYALRGTRGPTAHAIAAPMAPVIALMALAALGLSGYPVHEPVHARWPDVGSRYESSKATPASTAEPVRS
jgi:hypothetical protein